MAKRILTIMILTLVVISCFSVGAYATNPVLNQIVTSDETEQTNQDNSGNQARVSGLISSYSISASESDGKLVVIGMTSCSEVMKRVGFKSIIIQRRVNSDSSWEDYLEYEDVYSETNVYNYSNSISVPSGYQYRVYAVHYAYKNLFVSQKLENTSGTINF